MGTSENAVKTQIWVPVVNFVLIVNVKKELQLHVSLYALLQNLSVCVFEKIELQQVFPKAHDRIRMVDECN